MFKTKKLFFWKQLVFVADWMATRVGEIPFQPMNEHAQSPPTSHSNPFGWFIISH